MYKIQYPKPVGMLVVSWERNRIVIFPKDLNRENLVNETC